MPQAFPPSLARNQDDRDSPNVQSRARPFTASLLISTLFHISLVLLLSLVVLGTEQQGVVGLIMRNAADPSTIELPTFDLEPPMAPVQMPVSKPKPFELEVDVASPPSTVAEEPDSVGANSAEEPPANPGSETATTSGVAAVLSRAAISIQKRVSDAGGKKGEVQFALAWKNINDVDLHVITPSGERISHLYKRSQCGGRLDVDMNVRGESDEPVENVRWIQNAPWGRFTVLVNLFRIHRAPAGSRVYRGSEFQLLAQLGSQSIIEEDVVNRKEQLAVFRFQYLPDSVPTAERERLLEQLSQLQDQEEDRARLMLDRAAEETNQRQRDAFLNSLILQFPHTDAAIEAMQMLGGNIIKG